MKPISTNPWVVVMSAALFFCFEFMQINMFNALDVHLMREFEVDGGTLSWISAMYFYGNVLLLIPAGLMLDRFSTRFLILFAMSLSIVGTAIFALSTSVLMASAGRFLVGVSGGPFCLLSTMRLASRWFEEKQMAFVIGMIVSIGMIGGLLAQSPFAALVDGIGWRAAIGVVICCGLVILALLALFVQDHHPDKREQYEQELKGHKEVGFLRGLSQVASKPQNWYCGTFASLLNLPIFILGALWGSLYLQTVHALTAVQSYQVTSMLYIGMLIGSPLFGKISDTIGNRKIPMFIGLFICLGSTMLVMEGEYSLTYLIFWFLMIGFGSSSQVLAYPTVAESNSPTLTSSSESLAGTLIMAGGAIFQPVFGFMVEYYWRGLTMAGVPVYTVENYHFAMFLFPVTMVIAGICIANIKETNARRFNETSNDNDNLLNGAPNMS